tara:strand:- start:5368 stop:6762 length:1395 start_codon:yes stop_codon:yes gene_type:complete
MGLTREERQLLHQKSKQPTFGSGKPDSNQGNEGDIAYRQVEDSGLVQYVKQNGSWVAVGSQGDMPETRDVTRTVSSGGGVGSHNHGEFIKKDGSVAYTGNQSFGTNNITNVGTLDVDGATTLDRVTIDTADGAFAVSGANPINLTTTGTNKITLTSGNDIDIAPTGDLDIDANNITVDTLRQYTGSITGDYVLQGASNMTTQATGNAANTLLIQNTNQHVSSFTGINIKTDSGGAANVFNNIVINCDNVATKGSDYGVTIRSENGIVIEAADANAADNPTQIKMVANGGIDIGVDTTLTPASTSPQVRTLVHGRFEIQTLYKESGSINCSTHSVKFDQLDTQKLMRNFTYVAEGTLSANGYLEIVSAANDDNINGTVWLVTVAFNNGTKEGLSVGYCFRMNATLIDPVDMSNNYVVHYYQDGGTFGAITWDASNGIRYQNLISGSVDVTYKASAQRIQSGNDFS